MAQQTGDAGTTQTYTTFVSKTGIPVGPDDLRNGVEDNQRTIKQEVTHAYGPCSRAEIERLAILAEECGEVVQIVGKILRFGWNNKKPRHPELGTNTNRLEEEIGNIYAAVERLVRNGDVDYGNIINSSIAKRISARKWLVCQED